MSSSCRGPLQTILIKGWTRSYFRISDQLFYVSYLQGLGRDVFSVLQGTIRDVYRELKMVAATEKEDMVLAHVSLALEEIDNIVKSLFTPDNSIEKKIVVLDINN